MKFSVATAAMMMLTACGAEGVQFEGVVEHEGVEVRYETYWKRPDLTQKLNQEQTLTGRVSINGKTIALNPGEGCPKSWATPSDTSFFQYSGQFWTQVAEKVRARDVPKEHREDHQMIVKMLLSLASIQTT